MSTARSGDGKQETSKSNGDAAEERRKGSKTEEGLWFVCFGLKNPLSVERQSPLDSPVDLKGTRVSLWWTVLEVRCWK